MSVLFLAFLSLAVGISDCLVHLHFWQKETGHLNLKVMLKGTITIYQDCTHKPLTDVHKENEINVSQQKG